MNPFTAIVLSVAAAALLPGPASAYSHIRAHPRINELALEKFVSSTSRDPALARYQFFPDLPQLRGATVIKPGDQDEGKPDGIVNGEVEQTWRAWILNGGYTADEPELYNALRHFYDPKKKSGGKIYLTDHVALLAEAYVEYWKDVPDPQMDAREWAIDGPSRNGYDKNRYAWNRGLEYMERGFAETSPRMKHLLFAAAWRSLGETMHLLADMTVPAHVRNDAHPMAWNISGLRLDPYEYFVVIDSPGGKGDVIAAASRNALDSTLSDRIRSSKEVAALFHLFADHTNSNYFSADTVSGKDETGKRITNANGMAEYPTPRLDGSLPDALGYYVINKRPVAHVDWANGTWWNAENTLRERFSNQLGWVKAMDSSQDVAIAQAQELIPLAVAGGAKLVDWFIPRVNVVMTDYDPAKRTLSGRVTHVIQNGAPYARALVFNKGPAEWSQLAVDGRLYSETSGDYQLKIENGAITCTLDSRIRLDPGSPHTARIKLFLGGPWVESVDFKLEGAAAASPCSPTNPYGDCQIGDKLKHVNVGDQKKARLPTSYPECCRPHIAAQWDYENCMAQKKTACRAPALPSGCKCD